jgi:hypothetical protein
MLALDLTGLVSCVSDILQEQGDAFSNNIKY